jgi:hypothetical protein
MSGSADSPRGPIRPIVALGLATVAFVAVLVFALGMTSLVLGASIVQTPGLGQLPGIFATVATVGAFALVLWLGLRRPQPPYSAAVWTSAACYLAYAGALWTGTLAASGEFAVASEVAGRVATTWFGLSVAAAGGLCAVGGIALARTRAQRPRWPWEDEFDE